MQLDVGERRGSTPEVEHFAGVGVVDAGLVVVESPPEVSQTQDGNAIGSEMLRQWDAKEALPARKLEPTGASCVNPAVWLNRWRKVILRSRDSMADSRGPSRHRRTPTQELVLPPLSEVGSGA